MHRQLFLTGTGTDVGKTYVAALLIKKLRRSGRSVGYFKAAMSGNVRDADGTLLPGDALYVRNVSGIRQETEQMCPYVYENAYSPHLAARLEGNPVRMERVLAGFDAVCQSFDYVTVEGSGGILCPLRFDGESLFLPDFLRAAGIGCLLVADAGLGTINAVALTAFYLREKQIPLRGILLNRFEPGNVLHEDNRMMCEAVTGVPVVACLREGATDLDPDADVLASLYRPAKPQRYRKGGDHDLVSL